MCERMRCVLSTPAPLQPVVFDYATFLIDAGKTENISAYGPIVSRLGFRETDFLAEMRKFVATANGATDAFVIDKMREDALLALSRLLRADVVNSDLQLVLQQYLTAVLACFSRWKTHGRFRHHDFVETLATNISRTLQTKTEDGFFSAVRSFVDLSLNDSSDVEYHGNAAAHVFRGLLSNSRRLSHSALARLIEVCVRILESGIYDLRDFLTEAPAGTPLNELLRKYFVLPAAALAATFHSLKTFRDAETVVDCERLCMVLVTYAASISSFLANCMTLEAELVGLLKLILKMTKVLLPLYPAAIDGSFSIVQLSIQSRGTYKNAANYREILSDSCQLLLECAKLRSDLLLSTLTCFRDAVVSLDFSETAVGNGEVDGVNLCDTAAAIGPYIGALFRLQLDRDEDRTFCDSILNSLLSSMPEELMPMSAAPHRILACPHVIATLGHIAGVSGDEQTAHACLANLTAQFNKGSYGAATRIFFTQFNLIAVTGSGSLLANILDIYTNIVAEGDSALVHLAMDELGKSLVPLCKNEMIKLEVLLFTLMRAFIEKGLLLVRRLEKSSASAASIVGDLRPVLFAIWHILEHVSIDDFINKGALVDLFQEFWFVILFHGYQAQLRWDPLWQEFIPRVAEKSPLLIKEKDRIQTASTISLAILTRMTNSALRAHLITLMPNCATAARNMSFAQCLWLLAFYHCEWNKLELGLMDSLLEYLRSDVVYYLDLYAFVEDLSLTLLKDWLGRNMIRRHPETTRLALLVLKGCGNIQKRIHKTCLQFLKLILARERGLEGCVAIWSGLLDKLSILYKTCRTEMGIRPEDELVGAGDYIKDPEYAKEAFDDMLRFSREVFQTASYLYPHEYYSFVMNYFQSETAGDFSNVSYRNVSLLELLKSCHPDASYFDLPLDMHRNSESHFKWHLLLPRLQREHGLDAERLSLSVNALWKTRSSFTIQQLKDMMLSASRQILSSNGMDVDFEPLRCLVHLPFLCADHSVMNLACKLWMNMIGKMPQPLGKTSFLLGEVTLALRHHVAFKLGIFDGTGATGDPFKTKMTSTPSKPGSLELGTTVSTYYLYLVDFLRERFLIDSRETPASLHLYSQLIQDMLAFTLDFGHHGWSRAARFRILLLAYEMLTYLRNFWADQLAQDIYLVKAGIYRSLIDFFEQPRSWSIESRDLYEYESRTISALIDYIDKDSTIPHTHSEQVLLQSSMDTLFMTKSMSAPQELSVDDDAGTGTDHAAAPAGHRSAGAVPVMSLRQIFKHLLVHENEGIHVWIGKFKPYRMTLPPRAFWRELVSFAKTFSPLLALRFCQMVKLDPEIGLVIAPTRSPKSVYWRYMASVSLLESFVVAKIEIPSVECLLYSEPISPPLALAIFRQEPYKSSPRYLNFAMRSLECYPPDLLFFYIPQIVQNLRHDDNGYTETTIMHIAQVSSLFAHQVIWNMKANMYLDDAGTVPDPMKSVLEAMVVKIVSLLQGTDRLFYEREFAFFDKVTGISGLLKPYIRKEKWEKKKKIDEELGKIAVDPGVYLPSNPESCVIDIDYASGRPLQSFAKAPFLATFKVRSMTCPDAPAAWQSCIFKVGDDCRQDVMTLQLISAIKSIFELSHLHLYLFPYRVVATAPGCGVIEVIPNSISRDMLGREKINSLYEYFWFKYGNPNGIAFQTAREEFIKSMAAYSVITYLVAIRDRHNGNIMIDDQGHIVHIDFGFILDIAPGGITFEKSPFKLTSEMIQVMGGKEDSSPYFVRFQTYCVEAFLVLRPFAEQLIQLVEGVKESGLPCFKLGDATIRNLRNRFRLDLDEAEARAFMATLVSQSCENVRTDLYDAYQSYKNGIPY